MEKSKRIKLPFLAFFLAFAISCVALTPFLARDNGLLVLSNDFAAQVVPMHLMLNQAFRTGEVFWNWGIDIGSNLLASFAFYNIGSPFVWPVLFVPHDVVVYLIPWLMMLKFGVSGATAAAYIQRYVKNRFAILSGALLYSFSGAILCNLVFHFQDSLALFPLMLLGLDKLVEDHKRGCLAISCFLCALCNYILFVSHVVFVVIYFFVKYFVPQLRQRHYCFLGKSIVSCFIEGLLGTAMAAFLLVPAIDQIVANPRTSTLILGEDWFSFSTIDLLKILKAFLFPAEPMNATFTLSDVDWDSTAGYLPLFGIILVVIYLFQKRSKDWLTHLLITYCVIAFVPLLNRSFMMFTQVTYHRWFYGIVLAMALASAKIIDDSAYCIEKRTLLRATLFTCACIAFFLVMVTVIPWDAENTHLIFRPKMFTVNLIIASIGILLSGFIIYKHLLQTKFSLFVLSLTCVGLTALNLFNYQSQPDNTGIDFHINGTYSPNVISYLTEITKDLDPNILPYRYNFSDPGGYSYYNLAMTEDLPSINSFWSSVDASIFEFYDQINTKRETRTFQGPVGTGELLGSRYDILHKVDSGRKLVQAITISNGMTVYVYENPYALPIGITYDSYITQSEFDTLNSDVRSLAMLNTLVIKDEDQQKVANVLTHQDISECAALTEGDLSTLVAAHSDEQSYNFLTGVNTFSLDINSSSEKYAFFSVPYSDYWRATVNGKEEELLNINGLMALPIEEGLNNITFTYEYWTFFFGVAISLGSAVFSCMYLFVFPRKEQ